MKKILATLLVMSMTISMLVGCGGKAPAEEAKPTEKTEAAPAAEEPSGEATEEAAKDMVTALKDDGPFVVGMRFPVTIDTMQQQTIDNVTAMVESAGGSLLIENTPLTPEGNIQAYEKLIAAGVDGLLVIPASDSVLPRIKEMCEAAEIPWSIYFRTILDESIAAEVEASPYYVGKVHEDDRMAGYNLTKKMGEAGLKNIVLFSTALGDSIGEERESGMNDALKEYDMNLINEFRAVPQASDATQAMESVLSTHPEVDGIFISAGALTPGILPALTNLLNEYDRKDIKITIIDFPQGLLEAFEEGYMLSACGGHNVTDPMFSAGLLLNAMKGTPLSDKPETIVLNHMYLESAEDVINYFKYCESGTSTYVEEEVDEMFFKFRNDAITIDSFREVAEAYSIEDLVIRHKDLVD